MSKYFVFGGAVWVFVAFIIGIAIITSPSQVQYANGNGGVKQIPTVSDSGAAKVPEENSAVAKVHIEGTPTADSAVSTAEVKSR